jgi:hypothetical protein
MYCGRNLCTGTGPMWPPAWPPNYFSLGCRRKNCARVALWPPAWPPCGLPRADRVASRVASSRGLPLLCRIVVAPKLPWVPPLGSLELLKRKMCPYSFVIFCIIGSIIGPPTKRKEKEIKVKEQNSSSWGRPQHNARVAQKTCF